jgi:multiple sugar transport system permease protein
VESELTANDGIKVSLTVPPSSRRARQAAARAAKESGVDRGFVSPSERKRPTVRIPLATVHVVLLLLLIVCGLLPVLWLMKSAFTPTQDTLTQPLAIFPHGATLSNVTEAFGSAIQIQSYFLNTVWVAAGSWAVQILVATTGAFALSILRPRYGKIIVGMVLATLFLPAIVLLIPLYLTILHPLGSNVSLLNTFWAVWLPSGASAFNVVIVMRFFDGLPKELFEAARTDGAGPFRLFWYIVLPLSRPVLGVVTIFAIVNSWKDYLWPYLVLPGGSDPASIQPLSVMLPNIQPATELGPFLASLAIATLIPIILFLAFQRTFLNGSGLGGAVKG